MLLLAGAWAVIFPRPLPAATEPGYWGRTVVRIRLDCDANLKAEQFATEITQKTGGPLDRAKVQDTLQNLFATGRFRELRADVETIDSGVALILVARAAYFVGTVRVNGVPAPLDPGVLETASRLRLGQRYVESDLDAGRDRVVSTLKDSGYYRARVEYRVQPNPDTQAAQIVFDVVPGKAARLSSIEFHGDLAVPVQRLTSASGWKVHSHLTAAQLERGLFKIHQLYLKLGKPQATVTVLSRVHNACNNAGSAAPDLASLLCGLS